MSLCVPYCSIPTLDLRGLTSQLMCSLFFVAITNENKKLNSLLLLGSRKATRRQGHRRHQGSDRHETPGAQGGGAEQDLRARVGHHRARLRGRLQNVRERGDEGGVQQRQQGC